MTLLRYLYHERVTKQNELLVSRHFDPIIKIKTKTQSVKTINYAISIIMISTIGYDKVLMKLYSQAILNLHTLVNNYN